MMGMSTFLNIEVLFTSSKSLKPSISQVNFGKYEITTIPTIRESISDTKESCLLKFKDVWSENQQYSYPQKEADYVLSFVSLLLESKIEYVASKSNNVQGEIKQNRSAYLRGIIEASPNIDEMLKKLNSLETDTLRQFLRSCNAYRTSLYLIED